MKNISGRSILLSGLVFFLVMISGILFYANYQYAQIQRGQEKARLLANGYLLSYENSQGLYDILNYYIEDIMMLRGTNNKFDSLDQHNIMELGPAAYRVSVMDSKGEAFYLSKPDLEESGRLLVDSLPLITAENFTNFPMGAPVYHGPFVTRTNDFLYVVEKSFVTVLDGRLMFMGSVQMVYSVAKILVDQNLSRLAELGYEYRVVRNYSHDDGYPVVLFESYGRKFKSPVTIDFMFAGENVELEVEPSKGWIPPDQLFWQYAGVFVTALLAALLTGVMSTLIVKNKLMKNLSYTDSMTGLPNMRAYQEAEDALETVENFSILYIDLNHFKQVNDTYGHSAGNEVLKFVAGKLREGCGEKARAYRTGGDEFIVIVDGGVEPDELKMLKLKLETLIEVPLHLGGHFVSVGVSIGAAQSGVDGEGVAEVERIAEDRMYREKQAKHAME